MADMCWFNWASLDGHTSLEPLATFMDQAVGAAAAAAAGTAEARPTCDICGRHFFNKQTLERHMDRHRPVRQSYECEVCHKTYAFVTGLYHHRKTHGSIARFKCNFCGEHFMYSRSLYKHVIPLIAVRPVLRNAARARGVVKGLFKCNQCRAEFTENANLSRHRRTMHAAVPSVFVCHICTRTFNRSDNMHMHIKNVHGGGSAVASKGRSMFTQLSISVDTFTVRACLLLAGNVHLYSDWDIFTSSLASLISGDSSNDGTVEMAQTEEKLGPAKCPICHKLLCNYFIMKRHMVLHDQNRLAYECALCNKTFKWKHGLIRHCRTAHPADVDFC
nr:zinc finger protein 530-like [Rhipicephalus microplus]